MSTPAPRLQPWFVGLDVLDVETSVRFYRDVLGIPLKPVPDESSDPWIRTMRYLAVWEDGRTVFALYAAMAGGESRGVRVGFSVRDLEAVHAAAVNAGADVLHPPRAEAWGRLARFRDPDGNIVGVSEFS